MDIQKTNGKALVDCVRPIIHVKALVFYIYVQKGLSYNRLGYYTVLGDISHL